MTRLHLRRRAVVVLATIGTVTTLAACTTAAPTGVASSSAAMTSAASEPATVDSPKATPAADGQARSYAFLTRGDLARFLPTQADLDSVHDVDLGTLEAPATDSASAPATPEPFPTDPATDCDITIYQLATASDYSTVTVATGDSARRSWGLTRFADAQAALRLLDAIDRLVSACGDSSSGGYSYSSFATDIPGAHALVTKDEDSTQRALTIRRGDVLVTVTGYVSQTEIIEMMKLELGIVDSIAAP